MQLEYDREQNRLIISVAACRTRCTITERHQGIVDVVEGGRLLGVEIVPTDGVGGLQHQFRTWLDDSRTSQHCSIESDGSAYIELTEQHESDIVRSCEILVTLEIDSEDRISAISFPRRATGYEISYPSGNR